MSDNQFGRSAGAASRRKFLIATGIAGLVAIAGCSENEALEVETTWVLVDTSCVLRQGLVNQLRIVFHEIQRPCSDVDPMVGDPLEITDG